VKQLDFRGTRKELTESKSLANDRQPNFAALLVACRRLPAAPRYTAGFSFVTWLPLRRIQVQSMRRYWLEFLSLLILAALLMFCASLAAGMDNTEKAQLKKLEGTWVHVETERDGKRRPEPRTLWVFQGDQAGVHFQTKPIAKEESTWTFQAKPTNLLLTYHFRLDPTENPKTIDEQTEYRDGKTSTKPILGIYKLEGDILTICFAGPRDKGKRPTEFTAPEGTGRRIEILKREKQ